MPAGGKTANNESLYILCTFPTSSFRKISQTKTRILNHSINLKHPGKHFNLTDEKTESQSLGHDNTSIDCQIQDPGVIIKAQGFPHCIISLFSFPFPLPFFLFLYQKHSIASTILYLWLNNESFSFSFHIFLQCSEFTLEDFLSLSKSQVWKRKNELDCSSQHHK